MRERLEAHGFRLTGVLDEDVMEDTLVAGRAQAKQLGLPRLHEPDRAPVAAHTHEARIVVCVRAEGPHGWLFYGHPHVVLARKVNQRVGDPKGVDVGKEKVLPDRHVAQHVRGARRHHLLVRIASEHSRL